MLRLILSTSLAASAIATTAIAQSPIVASAPSSISSQIKLRYASFDPTVALPEIPEILQSGPRDSMRIVQFQGIPTQADRDTIEALRGEIIGYLPSNAYVVRMGADKIEVLESVASVRWVGDYHPAFRLDPDLQGEEVLQQPARGRYNVVVANKRTDKPSLVSRIKDIGGIVNSEQTGSLLIEVTLSGPQLVQALHMDEVLWIDRWSAPELDMDNARIQGGGNYVESMGGYTGTGVNAHIYEGVEATHPDFTGPVINVRSSGAAQSHGHATAGIVFGNGNSNPAVRGMAPDAGKFYTNYGSVNGSRYQVVDDLVNIHNVSHTTASWGGARTFFYTSTSAESDDIVFDHDISWTQSQSNAGNQDSRPQAWAKNVFSIGGVLHNNNSNPNDDSWSGSGSTGPASDGRIKPTMCAYYDGIGTSDRTGGSGYSSGSWTSNFGGTSGATPIVAGHNVIALEMYTDEILPGVGTFGQALRVPGGTTHENRPHFTTLKALQVVNARQYSFTASSSDNRREHCGWGFPNLQDMYDNREKTIIIDETQVITQGETQVVMAGVEPGEAVFKVSLNWNEPAGNPSASSQLVNNLSLRVTSPTGVVYWGNNGLESGVWSVVGGSEDNTNSIENVFVQNPVDGDWQIEIIATAIVQDSHVETPAVDADYALVAVGGSGGGQFASTICPGAVNSLGLGARLELSGSATVADQDLTVSVSQLPFNSTGYAITSLDANVVINPGGSFGDLCIAGPSVGRFLGNVLNSGSTGEVSFDPDLMAFPTPSGTEAVMPGDTRYFQYWYRDSVFGFPVSNFSSAMRITFD
ncbi:MAG: S8 family serine peptidase [Planctomycetes bacterium]|nr:S8 family serine peptidase [Planctomycetota bacterium]